MQESMQREKPQLTRRSQVPGKVNWWLRLASSGWDKPQDTIEQREKMRRSQLLAWIVLGVTIALLAFIPAAYKDTPTVITLGFVIIGLAFIVFLNRRGWVTLAGILLVMLSICSEISVAVGAPGGVLSLVYLPVYDFQVIPVIIGASILPRIFAFVIAAISITLIYVDLIFQPHTSDLAAAIQQYGIPVLAGRPSGIIIITAVIAYLWIRGMDRAVERANRAEELHALETYLNQIDADHTARVKEFVQETINAISALANGQEGLLLIPPSHPWQEQAIFINTQLKQFYKLKQAYRGNSDQLLFASETLLRMLQRIYAGQSPVSVLDPRRFTTQVPITDEIVKYLYVLLQEPHTSEHRWSRAPHSQPDPFAPE